VIVTVTLLPAASVPDAGDAVMDPSRLPGSEIDQETGPPLAVSVSDAPSSGLSTSADGDTDSVAAPVDEVSSGTVAVATSGTVTDRPGAVASLVAVASGDAASGAGASAATPPLGGAVADAAAEAGFTDTERRCLGVLPGAVDEPGCPLPASL